MNSSKWKSPFQRVKKERQQPAARAHLGILEKKKDFLKRARIYHKHQRQLDSLKREAELRNPNEFYFSMITDMKEKPQEFRTKPKEGFTKEQRLLLETRDMNYVMSKIVSQQRKLEKLRIRLPVETKGSVRIFSSYEEAVAAYEKEKKEKEEKEQQKGDNEYGEEEETKERDDIADLRDEIEQREGILKKLQEVYDEMKMRDDMKKDPNFKEVEDEEGNIVPVWKTQRKK